MKNRFIGIAVVLALLLGGCKQKSVTEVTDTYNISSGKSSKSVKANSVPKIVNPNAEQKILGPGGIKPSIACDKNNNPHIVVLIGEGFGSWYLYDKTAGGWKNRIDVSLGNYYQPAGAWNSPTLDIDKQNDVCWITGIMVTPGDYNGCGIGTLERNNISTANDQITFIRRVMINPPSWAAGNGSVDPDGSEVIWINGGIYERLAWNNGIQVVDAGTTLFQQNCGERNVGTFRVSKAPSMSGKRGQHACYTGCATLSGFEKSQYLNNYMGSSVTWMDPKLISDQGAAEDNYAGLGTDSTKANVAYMGVNNLAGKTCINVWNGSKMLYGANNPLKINADAYYRFGPQFAPAKDGGAWLVISSGGYVYAQYIGADGVNGEATQIFQGSWPTLTVDNEGNLHFAFILNGETWYQKALIQGAPLPPPATTLIVPSDKSTIKKSSDIKFSWKQVTEANQYKLQVMAGSGSTNVFVEIVLNGSGTTQWVPSNPETWAETGYNWKVQTMKDDLIGPWSTTFTFKYDTTIVTPATKLIIPEDGITLTNAVDLRFAWNSVAEANRYKLQIAQSGVAYLELWLEGKGTTNYVPEKPENFPMGISTWKVQTATNNAMGDWSSTYTFQYNTNAPIIIPPTTLNPVLVGDIRLLTWKPVEGVTGYRILMEKDGVEVVNKVIATSEYDPGSLKDGIYMYKVQVVSNEIVSAWSPEGKFAYEGLTFIELVVELISRIWPF